MLAWHACSRWLTNLMLIFWVWNWLIRKLFWFCHDLVATDPSDIEAVKSFEVVGCAAKTNLSSS